MAHHSRLTCDWCQADITDTPCGRVRLERISGRHEIVNVQMLDACLVCFEKLAPAEPTAARGRRELVHPVRPPPPNTDASAEKGDNWA